jgi:hypothetical protein
MISAQAVDTTERNYLKHLTTGQIVGLVAGIELALFLSALDQTILNAALPRMSETLGSFERAPWIITTYLLSCAIVTPIAGRLADTVGTKRALVGATIVFTLASIVCGAVGDMTQLIAARALQGFGGRTVRCARARQIPGCPRSGIHCRSGTGTGFGRLVGRRRTLARNLLYKCTARHSCCNMFAHVLSANAPAAFLLEGSDYSRACV